MTNCPRPERALTNPERRLGGVVMTEREPLDAQARKLVASYYAYHAEYGEQPCPCEVCEKARAYFAAVLKEGKSG